MKRSSKTVLSMLLAIACSTVATANDQQIAQTIVQRLQHQQQAARMQQFDIGVRVQEGTVTVSGELSNPQHAALALDVARRVPGVKLVVNQLYVRPAGAAVNTATVTQQVTDSGSVATQPTTPQTASIQQPTPPGVQQTVATEPVDASPSPAASALVATSPSQQSGSTSGQAASVNSQPFGSSVAVQSAVPTQAQRTYQPQQPSLPQAPVAAYAAANKRQAMPVPFAASQSTRRVNYQTTSPYEVPHDAMPIEQGYSMNGSPSPVPMHTAGGSAISRASYDNPQMPPYAWPSYAAYPNYASVSYPHQYSPTAWPYIGPFYPYPQVPLGWRKVMLEWDDGWWFLDFKSK